MTVLAGIGYELLRLALSNLIPLELTIDPPIKSNILLLEVKNEGTKIQT